MGLKASTHRSLRTRILLVVASFVISYSCLMKLLEDSSGSAERLITDLKTRIEAHIVGVNQFDDITIMALRRKN